MEKQLSILIADLTGYTAMTEAYGGKVAACVIEKYIALAEKSLVGQARLMQRVGDQVMIISESPDDLAKTAIRLYKSSGQEPHFLPMHAGLHYGTVFEHYDNYYGSPVNVTARIAAEAGKGKILSSIDFIHALQNPALFNYISLGFRHFKNVSKDIEIVELVPEMNALGKASTMTLVVQTQLNKEEKELSNTYNSSNYSPGPKGCLDTFRALHEQLVLN